MQQPQTLQNQFLQVTGLCYSVNDKPLIDEVSFAIPQGKKVALIGLNGAGKSSLLRLLVGDMIPHSGHIEFFGLAPGALKFKDKLGYQASNMRAIANLTAIEYLKLCCQSKSALSAESSRHIKQVTQQWQLEMLLNRPLQQLSQGNLQKLMVAQAFLGQPEYLILDEPTQALDPLEQQRFVNNLTRLNENQLCIFSSHHVNETVETADLVLLLHHGKLIAQLDLAATQQCWFVSELTLHELNQLMGFSPADLSLTLSFSNQKNLFRMQANSQIDSQQYLSRLAEIDKNLAVLGEARHALMPLFALLANEGL